MKHPNDDGTRVDYAAEIYAAMLNDTGVRSDAQQVSDVIDPAEETPRAEGAHMPAVGK